MPASDAGVVTCTGTGYAYVTFLPEHRRTVFPDSMFVALFPSNRGRPSVPGDVIATVMVLLALERPRWGRERS